MSSDMLTLNADLDRRWLSIGHWSRRADWLRRFTDGGFVARVGLRNRFVLELEWRDNAPVTVSLWSGEPEESPGAAVIIGRDGFEGVRRIPVCGCGEQGCADASFQFRGGFPVDDLPALVDTVESLTATTIELGRSNFWRPDPLFDFTRRVEWPDQTAEL
jgi:hypothetical protein